jgi:antitoxin (DNA-binding transcriptional repressor) of toxin-antitoxin stability system
MMAGMEREVVHLSQAEAIRDIASILERVERGAEVVVEKDRRPAVVIQPAPRPGRLLSECIALADSHGSTLTLDEDFGKDLEAIIQARREPLDSSQWD